MIYSGLIYLYDVRWVLLLLPHTKQLKACRGVTGYFDVIEHLMTECHKFVKVIAIQIESRKGVRTELRDTIIGCLVSFLNICRITRTAVKEKKVSTVSFTSDLMY